jgi:aspartate carbamoyltransferase catalytic subunit
MAIIIDRVTSQEDVSMVFFPHRHLIGIKGLTEQDITYLLDKADEAVKISR